MADEKNQEKQDIDCRTAKNKAKKAQTNLFRM